MGYRRSRSGASREGKGARLKSEAAATEATAIAWQFVTRREILRLRPAPRRNRAKKKARDFAQDDCTKQKQWRPPEKRGGHYRGNGTDAEHFVRSDGVKMGAIK
jgi:hypothetical protein